MATEYPKDLVGPSKARISGGGRLVIPLKYRNALDIKVGDEVLLSLENDEVRLTSKQAVVRRAQQFLAQSLPKRSLVKELLSERKKEARLG